MERFFEKGALLLVLEVLLLGSMSQACFFVINQLGYHYLQGFMWFIGLAISIGNILLLIGFLNKRIPGIFTFKDLKRWQNWGLVFLTCILLLGMSFVGSTVMENLGSTVVPAYNDLLNMLPNSLLFLQASILALLMEELIFRYIFIGKYKRSENVAVVISSLIFSFSHSPANVIVFLIYFVMGFAFAGLYVYKKSYLLNACTHGLTNFLMLFIL